MKRSDCHTSFRIQTTRKYNGNLLLFFIVKRYYLVDNMYQVIFKTYAKFFEKVFKLGMK